ncbi:MAG: ATP-binding protein [Paracoccaceae bacterium]
MASVNQLIGVSLIYVAFLFTIAFWAERYATKGKANWLRTPIVYTLSLSIYCTAWTFFGAVGFAARSGMEFVTIYLGPSLVMIAWWWILRKLVRIGRAQRVTSVADLISSRYGKSNTLAVVVTCMAVIGITPYIALQLQSVVQAFEIFVEPDFDGTFSQVQAGFWVAAGLAVFTVLFGTRNLNANERHDGVVIAVAVEAVVKLVALLAVGIFVVWGLGGGPAEMMERIDSSHIGRWQTGGARWVALTVVAGAAFLCLPRMFQVLVVENHDERHLQIASWAFPFYLMLMSLFVVPIAVVGLEILPEGSNPDLFVLTLPLSQGFEGLATLSFLGGFSSATSMVIVATLALSTMVSNHIIMPIWLNYQDGGATVSGDVRNVVIISRRLSILGILALGYLYFRVSGGGEALAAMGLISFVGVAQFLPVMLGGMFWRGATRAGALTGLTIGFAVWAYSFFLPSIGVGSIMSISLIEQGPFGIDWLRPQALFGIAGLDPMVHAVVWSLTLNTTLFVIVSLFTFPTPLERLQGAQFVNVFDHSAAAQGWSSAAATSEDLMIMAQRILGPQEAQVLFRSEAQAQGSSGSLPEPTPAFLLRLERELAASVGAATAHAMVSQLVGGAAVSVEDLMAVADESAQILEYSNRLEAKSAEVEQTARKLREANEKLTALSVQKDSFLSQVSHELRTPMTSIRSFSEILRDGEGLSDDDHHRYASIIFSEALRLTRLLDDLLDLTVFDNGEISLNVSRGGLSEVVDTAVRTAKAADFGTMEIDAESANLELMLSTDLDRLGQVFLNLITNAQKYCDAANPLLRVTLDERDGRQVVLFEDNGSPIPPTTRNVIFEKFARIDQKVGTGAGLGLAICKEIMARLGGRIYYEPTGSGNCFVVVLPVKKAIAAQ